MHPYVPTLYCKLQLQAPRAGLTLVALDSIDAVVGELQKGLVSAIMQLTKVQKLSDVYGNF